MRREAVANAMMYGGGKDNALEIAVELERTEGGTLVVHIEDIGREFDPTQFPPRTAPTSLAEAKVGHLGIHLIRSFASGIHYERQGNRNRLTLRFIPPRGGATT
jgi:serine/threonine-protein kinase RsbW